MPKFRPHQIPPIKPQQKKRLQELTTAKERARFIEVLQGHIDIVRKERSYVKAIIEAGLAEYKHHTMLDALDAELNWRRVMRGVPYDPTVESQ